MNELKLICLLFLLAFERRRRCRHFSYLSCTHRDWRSNVTVQLAVPYWQCMQRSVILASAAQLSLHREQGTGVGPRENADLIRPTKNFSMGYMFCLIQFAFTGSAAGEGCPTLPVQRASTHVRLHSRTLQHSLTLSISQCAGTNPR